MNNKLTEYIKKEVRKLLKESLEVDIEYYYQGRCELFALALSNVLDYNIYFYLDDINNETYLIHVYCKDSQGNYFDASGLVSINDIEEDHSDEVPYNDYHILVNKKDFLKTCKSLGLNIDNKDKNDIKILEKYIKDNIENYTI